MKKLILIALACSTTVFVQANNDGETRTATVKVGISASDIIDIKAKYTELTVETWDKNEVEIVASIRFDGKITDRMQKFLDEFEANVKNNITSGAGRLSIDTNLDEPNKVQIGSKHVGIIVSYGDKELKVSYKIKSPGTNKYFISNSYEDVRLIGTFDEIDFTQYSGELDAGVIKSAKMNLKYGSATIESIESATMEIYEQKLNSEIIDKLEINTKYSDLELRNVGMMEATSYESDIQIGLIKELKGNFKYGEININERLDNAKLTLYEMDIEAEQIGTIRLENSKYSKFDIAEVRSLVFDQSYEDETEIGVLGTFKSLGSKYGNHSIGLLNGSLELNAYEDEIEINRLASSVTYVSIDGKYIDSRIETGDTSFILKADVKYGRVDYDESKVNVTRYIKDGDKLQVEAKSKNGTGSKPIQISVNGYEVDIQLN